MTEGTLYVVTGPSGVGKGTVLREVKKKADFTYSVSATTRPPREGEQDGREYYFLTKKQFERKIKAGLFLEYASYVGNYYGTPLEPVEKTLANGEDVLLEIEVQGALQVKEKKPDAVLIFIAPPSLEELRSRLLGRGSESEEVIEKRLLQARQELGKASEFSYIVVNDVVETAADDICAIFRAQKCRYDKNRDLPVLKGDNNA